MKSKTNLDIHKRIYVLLNEEADDAYVSIGFGRFKKKGEEDKEGSQTFIKDKSGKIVPIEDKPEAGKEKKDKEKTQGTSVFGGGGGDVFPSKEKEDEEEELTFKEKVKILAQAFGDWWDSNNAWKEPKKPSKPSIPNRSADTEKLQNLMPGGDFSRRPLSTLPDEQLKQITTKIDDLAKMGAEAKAKGEKAPNYNLCQVSIPGTNLYCQGNKGVPRAEMPQFKGTPEPGSPADKLPRDKAGEVDTEEFFKQMLEKDGVKVSEPTQVPPDRLRSTQSELVGVKVAGMSQVLEAGPDHPAYTAITAPIYVSNDGYVLDGHHRWAAVVAHNAANPDNQIPMNVRVIDEPIEPLVKRSNKFAEEIGIKPKAADTGAAGGPSPLTKENRIKLSRLAKEVLKK
jgi:hypothetical protein